MSGRKKVNPNRMPVTKAEVNRERKKATDAFLLISLYALMELGAEAELIKKFEDKFTITCQCVDDGSITSAQLRRVVREEYKGVLKKLDEINGLNWEEYYGID